MFLLIGLTAIAVILLVALAAYDLTGNAPQTPSFREG